MCYYDTEGAKKKLSIHHLRLYNLYIIFVVDVSLRH